MDKYTSDSSTGNEKPGFFYGYIIVLVGFLVMTIIWAAIQSFGVFLKPMSAEFGWTRAMTAGSYSLAMFLLGFFFIMTGRLNDRFGPRIVVTVCGFCLGLGYLLVSQISALWQLYLLYGVMVAIGASGGFVPLASTVARWFVRRRGLMTGIVLSGLGAGAVIGPPIASWLISNHGWRTSYFIIGGVTLVALVLIAQPLRRDPAQVGQLPYGYNAEGTEVSGLETGGYSPREAVRTKQFWMLGFMYLCWGISQMSVTVHIVPHATDLEIPAMVAANILAVAGGASIVGRIGLSSFSDRIGNKPSLIISFVFLSASLLWVQLAGELWTFYVFAVLFGIGFGGIGAIISPVVAELFGLRAHGAVLGTITLSWAVGSAVGPIVAGRVFDTVGSYSSAFMVFAALNIAALIVATRLKPTRRESPA